MIYDTAKLIVNHKELAENVLIGDFVFIALDYLTMGEGSQINTHASATGMGRLLMGKNVVVSYGVRLITGTDQPDAPYMSDSKPEQERHVIKGEIILEDGVFIGANTVICVNRFSPWIRIGKNTVIGANAYIDRSITPDTLCYPLQKLKFKRRLIERHNYKKKESI